MADPVVKFGGVDRTTVVKVNTVTYSRSLNRRSEMQLMTTDETYRPVLGQPAELSQDAVIKFAGLVKGYEETTEEGTDQLLITITCADWWYRLDGRRYTGSIGGGESLRTAMERMLNQVLDEEGFTITGVPSPGPTITETLRFNHESVSSVLNKITQATGFFCYISPAKNITFSQFASNPAPFSITWTNGALSGSPKIRRSMDGYRNRQFARTQYAVTDELVETFDGDGSTYGFFVPQFMTAVPTVTVGGVPQVVGEFGIDGPPGTFDCFWVRDGIAIYFYQSGTSTPDPPPIGTANISVTYQGPYKNIAVAEDVAAIAARALIEGGSGKWEGMTEERNIDTLIALNALAEGLLRANSGASTVIDLPMNSANEPDANNLEPGHRLAVNLTDGPHDVNDTFLVESVKSRWIRSTRPEGDVWEVEATVTDMEPQPHAQEIIERIMEVARIGPDMEAILIGGNEPPDEAVWIDTQPVE